MKKSKHPVDHNTQGDVPQLGLFEASQPVLESTEAPRALHKEGGPPHETVPMQALQFIKTELSRTQKNITELQSERRLLRKQMRRCTCAVKVLQESQEDVHCRLEAKIEALTESSDYIMMELLQLRQSGQKPLDHCSNIQAKWSPENSPVPQLKHKEMLEYSKLKEELTNMMPVHEPIHLDDCHSYSKDKSAFKFQSNCQGSAFLSQNEKDSVRMQNGKTLAHMRQLCESVKAASRHDGNYHIQPVKGHVTPRKGLNICPAKTTEQLPKAQEEELENLVEKLKYALALKIQPGHHSDPKQELLHTARQVCKSYSDLINKVIDCTFK